MKYLISFMVMISFNIGEKKISKIPQKDIITTLSECDDLKKIFSRQIFEGENYTIILKNKVFHLDMNFGDKPILIIGYGILYSEDIQYFLIFDKFEIKENTSFVEFHSSSRYKSDLFNDFYKVKASLKLENGRWEIVKSKIEKEDCCKWKYEDL